MKKALLVAGAVLAVGLLLASLWWVQSGRTSPFAPEESPMDSPPIGIQMDENAQEGGLTLKSKEEIQEELNRKVEEGMINISILLSNFTLPKELKLSPRIARKISQAAVQCLWFPNSESYYFG